MVMSWKENISNVIWSCYMHIYDLNSVESLFLQAYNKGRGWCLQLWIHIVRITCRPCSKWKRRSILAKWNGMPPIISSTFSSKYAKNFQNVVKSVYLRFNIYQNWFNLWNGRHPLAARTVDDELWIRLC